MIRSLRLRLLVHASLAAAIVLGLLGLALYLGVRRSVESEYKIQSLLTEAAPSPPPPRSPVPGGQKCHR